MITTETRRLVDTALDSCRGEVEPALRAAVDTLGDPIRHIAGYHLGWWSADGTPTGAAGGKAIRPALAVLCAAAVSGDRGSAVPAAVAVELVHDFSLLHDDVMDHDLTRRHRATAWTVFGVGPAILTGDAMLLLATDVLARSGHPATSTAVRMLGGAVQELVEGQIADLAFEQRLDVTRDECLRMAEAKTGALLGVACALGGLFGGASPEQVGELDRFGRELGLAFQLVDDLLGIWGDPATTGKPVCNDLRCRKKSLPVVATLSSGTPAGEEFAALYGGEQELSESELARAAELIELAGGRVWSRDRAESLTSDALSRLDRLTPDPTAADELRGLARLITRRDR